MLRLNSINKNTLKTVTEHSETESELTSSSSSNSSARPWMADYGDDDDDDDDDEENQIDAKALALTPQTHDLNHYGGVTSIIKNANQCTVYERSHIVNTYNQVNPDVHTHYIRQGKDFIKTKVQQLKPVYVETRAARECEDVLSCEHSLVIIADPGEGKTTTGIMKMSKLMNEGYQPIIITSPKDWNSKVVPADKSDKLALFIDDMFGTIGVDESKVNEWIAMNEVISSLLEKRNGSLKIICTTRKKLYMQTRHRLRRFKWFKSFRMVDISQDELRLNESEKTEILQRYFKYYKVPEERQCLLAAKSNTPHGFPHCVELYCTDPHCLQMGISFFISPLPAVEREIQILYEAQSTQYYALLLIHLSPGKMITVDLMSGCKDFDKTLLNKTRRLAKLPTKDGMDIVRAIEEMTSTYLREEDDGSVGFRHDTFSEMVGVIAARYSPIPAVNCMSMQFLSDKTKYLSYKEEDKNEVAILPKKCTHALVTKLTESLLGGEAFSACKHHAWDSCDFVHAWLDYVTKNESNRLKGNTQLDELMTTSLEIYQVMQRNSRPAEAQVGLMFLLYLNKKEMAREEIEKFYTKQILEDNERLSKFKKEHRCPSGRKLKHPYIQREHSNRLN